MKLFFTLFIVLFVSTQVFCDLKIFHSGKCADVEQDSFDNLASLIQWDCHGGRNQDFDLIDVGGYFMIRASHSGKCLDVEGEKTDDGVRIIQYDCKGSDNQLWKREGYQFKAKHSGKCMDVEGASLSRGARFIQYGCHGGPNQRFEIV